MEGESSRRKFLQGLTLAGAGLIAGCKSGSQQVQQQAHVDSDGNLVIDDPKLKADLWEVWKRQAGKPNEGCSPEDDHGPDPSCSHKGIHVKFAHRTHADPQTPPEDHKVNSLCSC